MSKSFSSLRSSFSMCICLRRADSSTPGRLDAAEVEFLAVLGADVGWQVTFKFTPVVQSLQVETFSGSESDCLGGIS